MSLIYQERRYSMTWYMIRDKVTGKHLPTRTGRKMSYTSLELTDTKPPRLFSRIGDAKQAKACWEKGILTPKFIKPSPTQVINWNLSPLPIDSMDLEEKTNQYDVHPVKDRDKADLEVVRVEINII